MCATPAQTASEQADDVVDSISLGLLSSMHAQEDVCPHYRSPVHVHVHVHEHRLRHTPSKLPGLRFGARGLLQVQPTPPAGHPSLPPAVSPPCPTGVGSRYDSTPGPGTDTGPGTASSEGCRPQSSLGPALQPVTPTANPHTTPPPPPPPPLPPPPSLPSPFHPVSNKSQSRLADDTGTGPASARASQPICIPPPGEHSPPSQASTYQPATTPVAASSGRSRSGSLRTDDTTTAVTLASSSSPPETDSSSLSTPARRPRAPRSSSWHCSSPAARQPPRRNFSWHSSSAPSPLSSRASKPTTTNKWGPGQQVAVLPSAVNFSCSNENTKTLARRTSSASRPPTSYKPLPPGYAISARIPPIRSFRSSGSRKSYPSDMSSSSRRYYDDGDEGQDPDQTARDRSLRALEGRYPSDRSRDVAHEDLDDDVADSENNTADIFMNIAQDVPSISTPHRQTGRGSDDEQSAMSRVVRTARTPRSRPSSVYSSIQKPPSPPLVSRRLSDQQVPTSRATRRAPEELAEQQQANRDASYQNSAIGHPALKLDSARGPSRVPSLKPSPITPRTQSVLDNSSDRNSIFVRRPSTRTGEGHVRSSSIKQPSGLSKSFNSSPLVPKNGNLHQTPNGQYVEASESSNSTAAPSTVWDELDELKSRIHRLELTGKMPKTSSAAISRTPEERPPTAGTGATTLSGSPKRAQTEINTIASSQKETQSNLKSILSKTKPFVSSDVYDAIEAAANDALSLSQLMGMAGQAGPISSGASTIGVGGPSTITDRQLRKKADSICRSLTELCIALKEEEPERKTTSTSRPQTRGTSRSGRDDVPNSPPAMRIFNGTGPDEPVTSIEAYNSPRVTRLDKRATFNFSGMNGMGNEPGPRYASSVVGGGDDNTMTGRKSSLVLARARRGVTEEPEDHGRKTALLRTRRAASEETEDQEGGRRSSMAFAPRRVTTIGRVSNIDEEPQMQSRAPSRAFTEVSNARTEVGNGLRINVPTRDSIARRPLALEPASASSALPRTRLITSGLPTPGPYSSRLMTPTTPGGRRFLQVGRQQAQEDNNNTSNLTGRLAEERGQRYSIAGPSTTGVSRGPSLHRKRHSGIPSISGTASNVGGYR